MWNMLTSRAMKFFILGTCLKTVMKNLGRACIQCLYKGCHMFWFLVKIIASVLSGGINMKQFFGQLYFMAFSSLPLIALTSVFTGMVLALQSYSAFKEFSPAQILPEIVTVSLTRELGPVLSGLMMAGRWGASIAAELATMRVTDQIDALTTLSTNPFRYLIAPRILAAIIALPFLTLIANIIGILGGTYVALTACNISSGYYISKTLSVLKIYDLSCGLIKSLCFGATIAFIGCYEGFSATGGAHGVGFSTTRGVVRSCIVILCLNYLLTAYLF